MKISFPLLGLIAALFLAIPPGLARAEQADTDNGVSFQTFYDQLSSQGQWINSDQYGYVFQPTETDPNWRPYTYGHWVNTDAGMTWVSDDSFGWATDHYGRWVNLNGTGWVWVPGYTWGPAWVSWRSGDDYVGWAPLPPDSDIGIDYFDGGWGFDLGFHIGNDCDLAYGIGPWWYNFCPVAFIGDRHCWRHFRDRRDNFAFIGRTRNLTNINFRRDGAGRFGRVHAEGPNVAALNARSHTPIENARLASVSRLNEAGQHGNSLGVFAPRVDGNTVRTTRPSRIAETIGNPTINHGTDVNHALAVNSQLHSPAATASQVQAARGAQGNFSSARVATSNTRFSRETSQPLTEMRTANRSTSSFGGNTHVSAPVRTFSTPAVNRDSTFTGQGNVQRSTVTPSRTFSDESRFTGQQRTFSEPARTFAPSTRSTHVYSTEPNNFRAPVSVNRSPAFQSSAPVYHQSAPSYHPPSSSFRSFAPAAQPHFNGGGAPVSHFSGGGNFGGGNRGGGGNANVNSGNGGNGGNGGGGRGGGGRH